MGRLRWMRVESDLPHATQRSHPRRWRSTVPGETIHNMPFAVTPAMVVDAMVAADSYSRAYQQESGQQAAASSH